MEQSPGQLTELEFRVDDECYPFVAVSAESDCRCTLRELLPRSDREYLEFFELWDGPVEELADAVADVDAIEARVVEERDDTGVAVLHVRDSRQCVATTLADEGVFLRELRAVDGEARVVAEVPPSQEPSEVVATVTDEHPSVRPVAKRKPPDDGSLFAHESFRSVVDRRLTDRQREVLVAAYFGGYFDRPRETTGTELAEYLDISPATLSQHLRAAQRKVFATLLEEGFAGPPSGVEELLEPGMVDEYVETGFEEE